MNIREHAREVEHYRVAASGYPYVFTVSRTVWDDAVFVAREELLATKEAGVE